MNSNAPEPPSGAKPKMRSMKSMGAHSTDVGRPACAAIRGMSTIDVNSLAIVTP